MAAIKTLQGKRIVAHACRRVILTGGTTVAHWDKLQGKNVVSHCILIK
jgi:hypothetical protein